MYFDCQLYLSDQLLSWSSSLERLCLCTCEKYVSVLNVGLESEPGNQDYYVNIKGQEEGQNPPEP